MIVPSSLNYPKSISLFCWWKFKCCNWKNWRRALICWSALSGNPLRWWLSFQDPYIKILPAFLRIETRLEYKTFQILKRKSGNTIKHRRLWGRRWSLRCVWSFKDGIVRRSQRTSSLFMSAYKINVEKSVTSKNVNKSKSNYIRKTKK